MPIEPGHTLAHVEYLVASGELPERWIPIYNRMLAGLHADLRGICQPLYRKPFAAHHADRVIDSGRK